MTAKSPDDFLCPHRLTDSHHVFNLPETDHWDQRGNDKVCSYCGSMHPEQFLKLLPTIKEDSEDIWIELNDRRNKIYIERRGVKNAGDGAIKVYTNHLLQWCKDQGMGDDEIKELNKQINVAVMISHDIFQNIVMVRLKKDMRDY